MNFSDAIFDAIENSTGRSPILPRDVKALVEDLRCILNVVEKENEAPNVQQWREDVHWKQFHTFMNAKAKASPYPPNLFRAHLFGALIPRFIDDSTEELCDSFGSDLHTMYEEEGGSEVSVIFSTPEDSVEDINGLVHAIAFHLKKTQIGNYRKFNSYESHLSQMVSLSGDLRWTMHTTCQRGKSAHEDQDAGLAIFDTAKINENNVPLWRVKDLLDFFDSNPRFDGYKIDNYARTWATNADEYLCWDFVPKRALVNFIPYENLTQQEDTPQETFLQAHFQSSKTLAVYKDLIDPPEFLSMDEYIDKVSNFMIQLMDHVAVNIDTDSFVNTMVENFRDPSQWGYRVTGKGDIEKRLRHVINIEFALGIYQSKSAISIYSPKHIDICERLINVHLEAAGRSRSPEY